jgi:outer membrane protein TolC
MEQVSKELAGKALTLNQSISIALAESPELALVNEQLYQAQGRTGQAQALLRPTITGTVGDLYLADALQAGGTIVGTLPLDIMGLLHAATDQAKFQEVEFRLSVNAQRNQIVYGVTNAFYGVLRAKALVSVATDNLQNSLDRLKDAELKYKVRTAPYFDVVRAQTDVADAERQVIGARNGVSMSTASLTRAMGIDVTTPLQVVDNGAVEQPPGVAPPSVPAPQSTGVPQPGMPAEPLEPAPPTSTINPQSENLTAPSQQSVIDSALKLGPEFQPVLKEALQDRPEIQIGDAAIAAANKGIFIARRSNLPTLNFSVGYFDIRNSTGTTWIDEPEALLSLSWPLYDGGLARERVKEARGVVSAAITQRRQAVDAVTLDVQQAYLTLVQARDQVAVANQALSQARAAFNLARVRYNAGVASRAGVSPLLEVSDAQAALTLAESNQVNALYDYNSARAQLDRAAGRYAFVAPKGRK